MLLTSSRSPLRRLAVHAALAASVLLFVLVAMTALTGVSQQTFERFWLPSDYASMLLASEAPLRAIVAVDDVYIVAYVSAAVLIGLTLGGPAWHPLLALVALAAVSAGVLDLSRAGSTRARCRS